MVRLGKGLLLRPKTKVMFRATTEKLLEGLPSLLTSPDSLRELIYGHDFIHYLQTEDKKTARSAFSLSAFLYADFTYLQRTVSLDILCVFDISGRIISLTTNLKPSLTS